MNEIIVALQVIGLKGLVITLGIVVVLLIIAVISLNKQISKMMELHKRELERQQRRYQELLDDKSSAIRELLAQKHELEENCKNYKEQRDFLMAGKAAKEAEEKSETVENQTT